MTSLIEAIQSNTTQKSAIRRGGRPCGVQAAISKIEEVDPQLAGDLKAHFAGTLGADLNDTQIYRAISSAATVSYQQVGKHRRGLCRCAKEAAALADDQNQEDAA